MQFKGCAGLKHFVHRRQHLAQIGVTTIEVFIEKSAQPTAIAQRYRGKYGQLT
jgi:hypothetical protein